MRFIDLNTLLSQVNRPHVNFREQYTLMYHSLTHIDVSQQYFHDNTRSYNILYICKQFLSSKVHEDIFHC